MSALNQSLSELPTGFKEQYAAIERFALKEDDLTACQIEGYAAPVSGLRPCCVVLTSGQSIISVARAARFSNFASDADIRRGWCGFIIGGFAQGVALGYDLQLRCVVSNTLLGKWTASELAGAVTVPPRGFFSVTRLREYLWAEGGCADYRHVLCFAADLGRTHGSRAVLDASYRYFLGRPVDNLGAQSFTDDLTQVDAIEKAWKSISGSEEFRSRQPVALAGPFDSGFPFPISRIDTPFPIRR